MKSLWDDNEAGNYNGDLELRVYTSRLLGQDKTLVLHGGGNTSVKIREQNILGEDEEILYVKGSGWDLETIEVEGFTPVRMKHLLKLSKLQSLTDLEMVNELRCNMTRASAPTPSVETILHALLPYKFVDHTHSDALVAVTNTKNGQQRIQEIFGDSVVIIPYVMPGFDLAKLCAEIFPVKASKNTIGMVLMNHGIFSFGASAKESYERMIGLVSRVENYLEHHKAWTLPSIESIETNDNNPGNELAALRLELSNTAGFPVILHCQRDPKTLAFANRPDLKKLSQQGPATPDHVIRTKRVPMIGRDIKTYTDAYQVYFNQNITSELDMTMLDPAPRVVLDPELGMCTLGRSAKDASIVADIYEHTIDIILRSTALGGFQALPAKDIFDVEYWELEQAKLKKGGQVPVFSGQIALITGAASGIGKACVDSFLQRGAAVIGLDLNPAIKTLYSRVDFLGIECDVASEQQIRGALEQAVRCFGGVDMLVLNAGLFPGGCKIEDLRLDDWHKVMSVNLDANLTLMRETHKLLKQSPADGSVVIIGSKNVPAPGPGAAAYSSSKAALNQLARVAALEWGGEGIRINTLHPDAVFDTGLWTDEVLESRARHYGMTVAEYKTKNILHTEVTSHDVAELATEMCGPLFAKTTAAQVPVDGGNDRVI